MKVGAYVTGDYFEGREKMYALFSALGREKQSNAGDILVEQGDFFPGFYLLTGGTIEVSTLSEEGRRKVLNLFTPRMLIGISSVERKQSRIRYACLTPVSTVFLPRESFSRWTNEMLLYFAQIQTWKSQALLKQLEYARYYTAEQRVLLVLKEYEEMAAASPGSLLSGIRMKKQQLADFLGITGVHLSHIIGKLEKDGLIGTTRTEIFLQGGGYEKVL